MAAAGFFGLLLAYSAAQGVPKDYTLISRLVLGVAACLLAVSLRLPVRYKTKLALVLVSTGFSLIAAETILDITEPTSNPNGPQLAAARRDQVPFDSRSVLQVIRDLRSSGVDAYPMANRGAFGERRLEINGERVFPLAGISNTTTVFCNELGEYVAYQSDEHGFNNPPGIWGQDRIDIVTIGDSFTFGQCVGPDLNTTARMRTVYDKSLNLGIPATGPLEQLAIMKEYAWDLKPRSVLWFYWEGNDILELTTEYNVFHPLRQYLETNYRQNLVSKQADIDRGLRVIVNREMNSQRQGWLGKRNILETLTLRKLRDRAISWKRGTVRCQSPDDAFALLDRVLRDGKEYVNSWGGSLHYIYLPAWARYGDANDGGACSSTAVRFHDQVLSIAEGAGLPVLDVTEAFDAHPDPLSLFPFRLNAHYNEAGYRLVADTVLQSLEPGLRSTSN